MSNTEGNAGTRLLFFLVGGFIGATVALLFAPKTGEETRALLGGKAKEGKDYLTERGKELKEQAFTYVEKGREAVTGQKEKIAAAIDAGKQAYREEKSRSAE